MTSVKCFSNWVKEAGRGHLCAFLSWGILIIYGITMLTRLSFDTDNTWFGIGSTELVWICAGLGIVLAFFEFFYLLQPKKQDLYYSLPVSKNMIFWSRYVHGLAHFLVPMAFVLAVCGIYEGSLDMQFLKASVSYTGKSILTAAAVFLIFYHLGAVCLTVCGNIVTAVLSCGVLLTFGDFFLQNVCDVFACGFFRTYYRLPLVEKLLEILSPLSLAGRLTGSRLYEKNEILTFVPQPVFVCAASVWIGAALLIFAFAVRKRKTERTGRDFVFYAAESTAEAALGILVGSWFAAFLLDISGLTRRNALAAGILAAVSCAAAVLAVHCLLEWKFQSGRRRIFRRKFQLAAEILAAVCICGAFPAGAGSFDGYFPEEGKTEAVGVSIDGLGMDYSSWQYIIHSGDTYQTDLQLTEYRLEEEGLAAALAWIHNLQGGRMTETENVYTNATICYYMKDGSEHYRTYPMTYADFESFASVYETEEYKEKAYPAPEPDKTENARFAWYNGVKETDMKLTADEKEALSAAYETDRISLKMSELEDVLPLGFLRVDSGEQRRAWEMPVYPSFGQTCGLLARYGVQPEKGIQDYPMISIEMYETYGVPANTSGGVSWKYYDTPEDIARWQPRLVPEYFDLQPLLCPLDYSEVKAVVENTDTNSTLEVECVLKSE